MRPNPRVLAGVSILVLMSGLAIGQQPDWIVKLPPGIPDWFAQLDTDHVCQVGLYEWKECSGPYSKSMTMDRNGDGFITVEELVYYFAAQSPKLGHARTEQR